VNHQKIYVFSGLGADRRVFERLTIPGELIHIDWLTPFPGENLQQYCKRLIEENNLEPDQILLGVSFGGIVAIEVAKLIPVKQVIIISSVQHSSNIPLLFRIAGYLHLYKFLPYSLLKRPNIFLRFAFSPISDEDYTLLKRIVADTETSFLKWAIEQILLWRNDSPVKNLIHLHGTSDKLFPFRSNSNTITIPHGGHFMIYNQAAEISEIIKQAYG
jgi:pimeloyl-ACP methyl ester carboxylesterase